MSPIFNPKLNFNGDYFADMKRVLAKQEEQPHVLDGRQLTVSVLHEVFQDNRDAAVQTLSNLVVDPDIMEYVQKSSHMDQLRTLLDDQNSAIDWSPGSTNAVIVHDEQPNGNSGQCVDVTRSFLETFVKWDVQIEEELWNTIVADSMTTVYGCLEGEPPLVKSITNDSSFYLRIVSLKSKQKFYDEKLKEILEEKTREKNYRKEKVTNFSKESIKLFKKTYFDQKLRDEFNELTVEFDEENGEIQLEGPEKEVINAIMRFSEENSKIIEKKLSLSERVLKLLNTVEGLQIAEAEMAADDIKALFVIEKDESRPNDFTAKVLGISPEHVHKASKLIGSFKPEPIVNFKEIDIFFLIVFILFVVYRFYFFCCLSFFFIVIYMHMIIFTAA